MIVVCPTSHGGHIEHAVNLASASADAGKDATVVSRRGSREYFHRTVPGVQIVELFPDLTSLGLPRVVGSVAALVVENVLLAVYLLTRPRSSVVLLEEPRFPLACLLRREMPALVLFVHNTTNHSGDRTLWARAQNRMQRYMSRRLPCVVHGTPQRDALKASGVGRIQQVALPGAGIAERHASAEPTAPPELGESPGDDFLLCLGEIRANKGFHVAIEAATAANRRVVVAGGAHDADYLRRLEGAASDRVTIVPRFLEPEEFSWLLEKTSALVLPYQGFSAQSGPLARAMSLSKRVLISDNPALMDQVKNYPLATIVGASDPTAWAGAMQDVSTGPPSDNSIGDVASAPSWTAVAAAVHRAARS
nr:glycosyltransferase [uncultured Nocardioides sp.]